MESRTLEVGCIAREYMVELVRYDSDHWCAKYVEDEEEMFITWTEGDEQKCCLSSEFFYLNDVDRFITVKFEED